MKDEVLWNTFRLRLKIFPKHFGELCVHSYRTFFLVFQTTKLFITLVAEISIHLRNNHSYSHTKSHWDCQTTPRQTDSRGCRSNHRRPWRASLFAEDCSEDDDCPLLNTHYDITVTQHKACDFSWSDGDSFVPNLLSLIRINCFVRTNEDKQLTPGRIHTQRKINLLFVSVDDLTEFCKTD